MTKLDSQHRILIPMELLISVSLDALKKVSLNYDSENNSIYLDSPDPKELTCCVSIRALDEKNRIALPRNILELIEADYTSKFIVYVRYGRIHISKFEKETPDT